MYARCERNHTAPGVASRAHHGQHRWYMERRNGSSLLTAAHRLSMKAKQPVRHVIVFKFVADATDDQITATTNAFRDLKHQIPGIISFEHGANVSSEGLDQGFNHAYVVTFEDAAA